MFIILAVSVIGLPLAILWMIASPLALILMCFMGYSGIALVAGRKLQQRFRLADSGPYVAVLLGIALIQGWTIIGEAFSFLGGPIRITAWLLILLRGSPTPARSVTSVNCQTPSTPGAPLRGPSLRHSRLLSPKRET